MGNLISTNNVADFQRADSEAIMAAKIGRDKTKQTFPVAPTLTKDPDRQRGFWSFLTWPFILSDVIAGGLFIGKGAQAAQAADQSDEHGRHGVSHSKAAFDAPPDAASKAVTEIDDVQNDAAANDGHAVQTVLSDNLQFVGNAIDVQPLDHESSTGASGGGGGGGGGGDGGDGSAAGNSGSSGVVGANAPGADAGGIDVGVHVDQLLGFDLRIDADGVFVGVDSDLGTDLNPARLVSDIAQNVGLGNVDQHNLLGFDVHLGPDGFFVVSDLVQSADLNAGIELNSIPALQHQGSSSPIADSIQLTGLPDVGNGLIGDNAALGLADGGFGLFSGAARVPAIVLSAAGGTESIVGTVQGDAGPLPDNGFASPGSLTPLQAQGSDIVGLSDTAPAHVVWTDASADQLGSDGNTSSGDTLKFSTSPPAQIDDLFNGNRYTDYNMSLQSTNLDGGKIGVASVNDTIGVATANNTVDHAIAPPSPIDVTPLKGIPATNTPFDHAPSVTEELVGHSHIT
jgi:hypothetical protein